MTAQPARDPAPRPTPPDRTRGGRLVAFDGGGGGGAGERPFAPGTAAALGMWIALVPLAMFFLALASAYMVRQGLGQGWGAFPLPGVLWANTAVLLASGALMEVARRGARTGRAGSAWIWGALGLGLLFLAGQVAAWRQLSASGIALGTTPYGSFLYLLTGSHALHLAGGLLALLAAAVWPTTGRHAARRATVVRTSAIYWHFMHVVWLGLFLLLVLWR